MALIDNRINDRKDSILGAARGNIQNNDLTIKGFEYLYKFARTASEENLIDEKFFTKKGKNLSHFIFIKGANPEMVADCFIHGLVKCIYPSQNLQEIKLLPKTIYKAIG